MASFIHIYKYIQIEFNSINLFLHKPFPWDNTMSHLSSSSYQYNYRRLLFHLPPTPTTSSAPPPYTSADRHDQSGNYGYNNNTTFDSNVIMILTILLCALICSLGLNSLIRCALRCSTWMSSDSHGSIPHPSARLTNTGVKKKALKTFPIVGYSAELDLPGIDAQCVICLSEFCPGDQVRFLPRCHHGFHARCIDKWLSSHSSCPTCRQCLLETCEKIVDGYDNSTNHAGSTFEV